MANASVIQMVLNRSRNSCSRRMLDYPAREVIPISRDLVQNLMRRMGLRAIN